LCTSSRSCDLSTSSFLFYCSGPLRDLHSFPTRRSSDLQACEFLYRESIFKKHKEWIIFSTDLVMETADAAQLRKIAGDIVKIRNEKFPVTMKCAGSIFKNLMMAELPERDRKSVE